MIFTLQYTLDLQQALYFNSGFLISIDSKYDTR